MAFSDKVYKVYLLIFLSVLALILAPFLGVQTVSLDQVLHDPDIFYVFVFYRLPRVFISYIVGSVLALAGLTFQSIFANPLATPYTLGVSTAASLGAVVMIFLNLSFSVGIFSAPMIGSIIFASFAIVFLFLFAQKQKLYENKQILLLGVALNFLYTSFILFFQFKIDYLDMFKIMHWLIGSVQSASYDMILTILVVLVFSLGYMFFMRRELDLLSLGEEFAKSKGVNVVYVRWLLIFVNSVLVGVAVSFVGPIAFIGLIVPNIARIYIGAQHKWLIPTCVLLGGVVLVLADMLSRTMFSPVEMPIGIFTSFIGALFFMGLLIFRGKSTGN